MNPLDKLPEEMSKLLDGFMTHMVAGGSSAGVTAYIFWMAVAIVLLLVLIFAFKARQAKSLVPEGIFVNACEYVIEFVRDDVCRGILGESWKRLFPFLASLFFFILLNGIVGIIPGCRPGTGTIGVTAALAICSFVYFIAVGVRRLGPIGYLKSLAPKGVSGPMAALVWVIELFSTFIRLVTLAVRLFCNMFAGHVVMGTFAVLSSLFFEPILNEFSTIAVAEVGVSVFWLVILIIIYLVEIMVGVIQAYVFTLLSAVYIQLVEDE